MSYLEEWEGEGLNQGFIALAREQVKQHFWQWYADHHRDKIGGFLFWTVRVNDLRWLFVQLFGEPNS